MVLPEKMALSKAWDILEKASLSSTTSVLPLPLILRSLVTYGDVLPFHSLTLLLLLDSSSLTIMVEMNSGHPTCAGVFNS
jgi:hypothetical protein